MTAHDTDRAYGPASSAPGGGNAPDRTRIALVAVIVLLAVLNIWQWVRGRSQQTTLERTEQVVITQTEDLSRTTATLDSIGQQLEARARQVERLGGDTAALGQLRRDLARDLAEARRTGATDKARIRELRLRIDAYTFQLNQKDEEIAKLTDLRDRLYRSNRQLETRVARRDDSIQRLQARGTELASQVALASRLKAENARTTYFDPSGTERDDEVIRARRLGRIKFTLQIADNPVAQVGTRDAYLRVIGPDGQVLGTEAQGAATFSDEAGNDLPYTLRQSFIFDNQQPRVTFIWDKGATWAEGAHRIEVYCEGRRLAEGRFVVR